jgi:hypothetical protein
MDTYPPSINNISEIPLLVSGMENNAVTTISGFYQQPGTTISGFRSDSIKQVRRSASGAGFEMHPENINRKGRPPKDWTWNGLLEQVAEEVHPETKQKFKYLVSKRLWVEAIKGNIGAIKELFARMEGLPMVRQEISGPGGGPIGIASLVARVLKDKLDLDIEREKKEQDDNDTGTGISNG